MPTLLLPEKPCGDTNEQWYVYILRCRDGTLYTGVTTNLERRLEEHNFHPTRGAKYTHGRRPVCIVHTELHFSKSSAMTREAQIKSFTRAEKIALINIDKS